MFFQDTMDHSRVVKVIRTEGRQNVCKIFWKDKIGLAYGGEAEIPASLFAQDNLRNKHIGFVPIER